MSSLCHSILDYFSNGIPLVLVTVTEQSGSAPRTAGARMLVKPDGGIFGTVGGGRCEAEAIAAALFLHRKASALACAQPDSTEARPGRIMEYSLRGENDMDMICGGELTLLLEFFPARNDLQSLFTSVLSAEEKGSPFMLVSRIQADERAPASGEMREEGYRNVLVERFLVLPEECSACSKSAPFPLPQPMLAEAIRCAGPAPHYITHDGQTYFLEPFPRPCRIVLFGAGHVGRETAELMLSVGFQVIVVDDRSEFANSKRFPGCRVETRPSLGEKDAAALLHARQIGGHDGIVILTRGHANDREVLAAALDTKAGYIGMIGSASKCRAVFAALRKAGVSSDLLEAVHSPIGLPIGAETPREIAISITAELILWRSGFCVLKPEAHANG